MILQGDALVRLQELPADSIDCCVTSPPYYQLRDYGAKGQIGLEGSVQEYIDRLVDVFREVHRVLKPDGTLWVNIGDGYAGSGKGAAKYPDNAKLYKQGTNKGMLGSGIARTDAEGCKPKDLIGIPFLLAFALRADGWYWRQVNIWEKPNCMPESVTDRCTNCHEYILMFSKSAKYYFDYEAIQEERKSDNDALPAGSMGSPRPNSRYRKEPRIAGSKGSMNNRNEGARLGKGVRESNEKGLRRKRSVWRVAIVGSKYHHYATFPTKLIEPCILAGSRKGGTVLDPFAGTGTTGEVAKKHGRKYVLIELSGESAAICHERLESGQMSFKDLQEDF